jgi:hypothetical protein
MQDPGTPAEGQIPQRAKSFQRWPSPHNSKRRSSFICDKKSSLLNPGLTCDKDARPARTLWMWKHLKNMPHKLAGLK